MAEEKTPRGRAPRKARRPFEDVIAEKRGEIKKLTDTPTDKATSASDPVVDVPKQIGHVARELGLWQNYQRTVEIMRELASLRAGTTITPKMAALFDEYDRLQLKK